MTADDVAELVSLLKGLFPTFTPEQGDFWTDRLLPRERGPVERAINRYAELRSDMVDRAQLTLLIEAEIRRSAGNAASEAEWRRRRMLECEVQAVDRFIERLSDADLANLKAEVIRDNISTPEMAQRLLKADPRKSATLKAMIYERAKGAVAV